MRNLLRSLGPSDTLLAEEGTLFVSVLKWSILASITGVIVGGATRIFIRLIGVFTYAGDRVTMGHAVFVLPAVIPLVVFLVRKLAPAAEGHGTEKVIEAIHVRGGEIDAQVVPVKLLGTLLTLGAGGSVGKEGPAAQIGAGLAFLFSRIIQLNRDDAKRLVICGISAGFAAVFGTPISGAIFGAEVLYLGLLKYDVMFPCLVAGVIANIVCRTPRAIPRRLPVPEVLLRSHTDSVLIALASGIFFGVVALLLIYMLELAEELRKRIGLKPELAGLLGGVALIGIFVISPRSSGLGTDLLSTIFTGGSVPTFSAWWKTVATSITLGFGGSGGIITPLFVIGATSGYALAHVFRASALLLGAFGMVAVVAAGAGTPIAASVMALELFGPTIGTYAAIACCTAYIVVGHRSVYPSQIIGATKSPSLTVPDRMRVDEIHGIGVKPRRHSLLYLLGKVTRRH